MGNAVEKQKPLRQSSLCPWKQGKKVRATFLGEDSRGSLLWASVRVRVRLLGGCFRSLGSAVGRFAENQQVALWTQVVPTHSPAWARPGENPFGVFGSRNLRLSLRFKPKSEF